MSEATMPTTEAVSQGERDERAHYEFAFHILPTVVEGEVPGVTDKIKAHLTHVGAEITAEEAPERIELAYPVVKSMEGKNRKFTSSYFGWIRFYLPAEKLEELTEELSFEGALLRTLLIKLTRQEEENPFRFHEHRKAQKMVEVVDEEADVVGEVKTEVEEVAEVSETALDESLEKITGTEDAPAKTA
jgi:ribosomal protein S6